MYYPLQSTTVYTTPTAVYPKGGWVANYWQNGVPVQLPGQSFPAGPHDSTNDLYAEYVSGIFVSGGNVYVSGGSNEYNYGVASSYQFARYWDQGVATSLVGNLLDSSGGNITGSPVTTGIYVSGTDVYVTGVLAGSIPKQAVLWKDGVASILGNGSANSIFVSGSDVYIAGSDVVNGVEYATYWKNGVATHLSPGSGGASAIYVQ